MSLHYEHITPNQPRREALAVLLGLALGLLIAATLMTTWQDADALDQQYARRYPNPVTTHSNTRTYTVVWADDGSLIITVNGRRMYLTTIPHYQQED